jgi:hypothetical protein
MLKHAITKNSRRNLKGKKVLDPVWEVLLKKKENFYFYFLLEITFFWVFLDCFDVLMSKIIF